MVVAFVLVLSILVSILEMSRIRRSMDTMTGRIIDNMNAAVSLLDVVDTNGLKSFATEAVESFMTTAAERYVSKEEKGLCDSILYAYTDFAYGQLAAEDKQVSYRRLRSMVKELIVLEQNMLHDSIQETREGLYRSLMPGVIALASSVLLLFLLSYFIRLYLLLPLKQMSKGMKNTLLFKQKYKVKAPEDEELMAMNDSITRLCDQYNKS